MSNNRGKLLTLIFAIIAYISPLSAQECLDCHAKKNARAPRVDVKRFEKSVHKGNGCESCHQEASTVPHPKKMKPVLCAECHADENAKVMASGHDRTFVKRFGEKYRCTACHDQAHYVESIRNADSTVNRGNVMQTCFACHAKAGPDANEKAKKMMASASYATTVHGKAFLEKGNKKSAICTDCHGSHDLELPTNSASKVYKFNIPDTCGSCHAVIRS